MVRFESASVIAVLIAVTVIGAGMTPALAADARADTVSEERQAAVQSPLAQQNTTTPSPANATNATVSLRNQTTDGQSVVVHNATLPTDGFVVIHGPTYLEGGSTPRPIAVSAPLEAGSHRNITVNASSGIPGSQSNMTEFTGSRYAARLYPDSNDNGEFDYYRNRTDAPYNITEVNRYLVDTNPYIDAGLVLTENSSASQSAQQNASSAAIEFSGRTPTSANATNATNATIIVDSVTLPRGGFVTVYNDQYLPPTNATVEAVIGSSEYLSEGTHRNVTVEVYNVSGLNERSGQTLREGQQVVVSPAYDSNGDRTYDYVTSDGSTDVPYTDAGERVSAAASVRLSTASDDGSSEDTSSDGAETDVPAISTETAASTDTRTPMTTTADATTEVGEQRGMGALILSVLSPSFVLVSFAAVIGLGIVVARLWDRNRGNDRRIR